MDTFFTEYLERLDTMHKAMSDALDGLPPEALDWSPAPEINSISVLVAHATGAERYWIGDVAMGEYKERDRDLEFQMRGLTAADLKARIEEVGAYAHAALERLSMADLDRERPSRNHPAGETFTIAWTLVHALGHTSIHAGHIQLMHDWWRAQPHPPAPSPHSGEGEP